MPSADSFSTLGTLRGVSFSGIINPNRPVCGTNAVDKLYMARRIMAVYGRMKPHKAPIYIGSDTHGTKLALTVH